MAHEDKTNGKYFKIVQMLVTSGELEGDATEYVRAGFFTGNKSGNLEINYIRGYGAFRPMEVWKLDIKMVDEEWYYRILEKKRAIDTLLKVNPIAL